MSFSRMTFLPKANPDQTINICNLNEKPNYINSETYCLCISLKEKTITGPSSC